MARKLLLAKSFIKLFSPFLLLSSFGCTRYSPFTNVWEKVTATKEVGKTGRDKEWDITSASTETSRDEVQERGDL